MSGVRTLTVAPGDADIRLDRWFQRHFPQLTHGHLQKLLRKGEVRVDGGRAKASDRLSAGQSVRVPPLPDAPAPKAAERPADEAEAEALQDRVLFRDDFVIAIDKPAGMAVQGGKGTGRHLDALLDALRFGAAERPRLVHRLDRDTSGVLLLARDARTAAAMTASFQRRETQKLYWAVVVGLPSPRRGRIDLPLARHGGPGAQRMAADAQDGQRAVTLYEVVENVGKRAAWVALSPITGRTHQLRVHMAAIGHPILADGKYGGKEAFIDGLLEARRLHLHARSIRMPHPSGRGVLEVSAALPPHMRATWRFMGFAAEMPGDPFAAFAD